MYKAMIAGVGHYVPDKVINNFDFEKLMDTSDEWIRERSGIVERRWVKDGENNLDLAEKASLQALEQASMKPEDIDFIIFESIFLRIPFNSLWYFFISSFLIPINKNIFCMG